MPDLVTAPAPAFPRRPRRSLKIDAGKVVESVLKRADAIEKEADRSEWLEKRLLRYAKYRGLRSDEPKTFPWADCSDVQIPLMQIAELRTNAGLSNVINTMRPLVTAKALKRSHVGKEDRITNLLDAQLFVDPGPEIAERRLNDFTSDFLQDGNAVAFTPWIREEQRITTLQYRPPVPEEVTPNAYLQDILIGQATPEGVTPGLFPAESMIDQDDTRPNLFAVTYRDSRGREQEAIVEVFTDEDEALILVIEKDATTFDGPVMLPFDIEDVLVPTRCTNLQPPAEWNPTGAPHVFLRDRMRLDIIKRLMGTDFNYLTRTDYDEIAARAQGEGGYPVSTQKDDLKQQKDTAEGREHRQPDATEPEEIGSLEVEVIRAFDRWDVNGDGQQEDVYFVIAREAKVLLEARLLSERWPAERAYRPFAEACAITVPHRYYGIGLLELGEALQDLVKGTFDIAFDSWTMGTIPFFFYGAASKLSTDVLTVAPGMGIPVPGNPRETILFPNLPQRDQSTALGIIGLGVQFFNQLLAIGPLQQGQVPTGKASALRTFGTTQALLQQGDVRADQLLLQLFLGLRQVMRNFHRMNRHLLPPGKEVRILGWDGPKDQGYDVIRTLDEIDAEVEFDFRPDFLLSNPAMLNQALMSVLGVVVTPMATQMGITDPQMIYRLLKDFIRSLRLDPKLYIKPPLDEGLPALLAEEAISLLTEGTMPEGVPLEGAQAHLKKLFAWVNSDGVGFIQRPEYLQIARAYITQVAQRAHREQLVGAAQTFQQGLQAGGGQGMVGTTVQEPGLTQAQPANEIPEATGAETVNA